MAISVSFCLLRRCVHGVASMPFGIKPRGDVGVERYARTMQWSDLITEQPELGKLAQRALIAPGVLLIGTIRGDGTVRISGVEPLIMDGWLWLSMLPDSMKARDLYRDPRLVVNSIITSPEPGAEIKLRSIAHAESAPAVQERYATTVASQLGWQPIAGRFALFAVSIEDVTYIGYDEDTGGQHVARWPAGIEYIRPATTPTSLGPPQSVRRLLTTA